VTAYSIPQRTREIGMRVAVGAPARQIWWLVTRRAFVQIANSSVRRVRRSAAKSSGALFASSRVAIAAMCRARLPQVTLTNAYGLSETGGQ